MNYTVLAHKLDDGFCINTQTYKKIMIIYLRGDGKQVWFIATFGVN